MPANGCDYLVTRSPRHPIADLRCGVTARFILVDSKMPLCGVHANCLRRRGYDVIEIEPDAMKGDA